MDAGKGGHFPGRALRIATCHQDAGGWILTMYAAQKSAGGPVGLRGDATGIHDHYIGRGRTQGRRQAAAAQLKADGFPIRLVGAAPEILHVVFCHVASLSTGFYAYG
jgi:hypothetical protein